MAEEEDPRETVGFDILTSAEIEQLCRLEHNRWVARKRVCGYVADIGKPGREIRDALKIHPDIRGWEALSEEDKEKDSVFMNYETILKQIGIKMVRKDTRKSE